MREKKGDSYTGKPALDTRCSEALKDYNRDSRIIEIGPNYQDNNKILVVGQVKYYSDTESGE